MDEELVKIGKLNSDENGVELLKSGFFMLGRDLDGMCTQNDLSSGSTTIHACTDRDTNSNTNGCSPSTGLN